MSYIDDIANLQRQMENYTNRLNAGRASKKDRIFMVEAAGSCYEALEKYLKQEPADAGRQKELNNVMNEILNFQDGIISNDIQKTKAAYDEFSKTADIMVLEYFRLEQMMKVFGIDLKEMDLHADKMKIMQNVVDIDIKLYGSVSKETMEIIDVQHCELVNNLVQEKNIPETDREEKPDRRNSEEQQENHAVSNMKPGGILKLKLPRMDPGQKKAAENMLFQAGARYSKYRIPAEKSTTHGEINGRSWYVRLAEGTDLKPFIPYIREAVLRDARIRPAEAAIRLADALEWGRKELSDGPGGHRELITSLADKLNDKGKMCRFTEILHKELSQGNGAESLVLAARDVINGSTGAVKDLDKLLDSKEEKKPEIPVRASGSEQAYQGSAYLKGTGEKQKPVILHGSSPEDIITTLRGRNRSRTEDQQLKICYIRKLNTENNRYENTAKYDIASGTDITPIYLNLPHMGRDKFTKVTAELKSNGAKYNPVKKAFFITRQDDLNKFSKYLPIAGAQSEAAGNRIQNELSYEVESGQEYYDNRIKVTIEGMEPFNVYGGDYDVHFPSLSAESTRDIIEKFVLPGMDVKRQEKAAPKEAGYNGRKYDPRQYDVLELAISQNFTQEQMSILERPELSSDRLNEIRFAIRDGLSAEQIAQFATPEHEQWQMDLCRIGMQHGMSYEELKPVISPEEYTPKQWGERRNQLSQMIKEKERGLSTVQRPDKAPEDAQDRQGGKSSVLLKLSQNKAKLEAVRSDTGDLEKKEKHNEIER